MHEAKCTVEKAEGSNFRIEQDVNGLFNGHVYQLKFSGLRSFEQAARHVLDRLDVSNGSDQVIREQAARLSNLEASLADEQRRAKDLREALLAIRKATSLESMVELVDSTLKQSPGGRELLELFTGK